MAKAPPRIPDPRPTGRRVFAHIVEVDLACPGCGRMYTRSGRRAANRKSPHAHVTGYDHLRGVFWCGTCGKRWQLGVIFYPLTIGQTRRPADTFPTLAEAAELRQIASQVAGAPLGQPHANRVADHDPTRPNPVDPEE